MEMKPRFNTLEISFLPKLKCNYICSPKKTMKIAMWGTKTKAANFWSKNNLKML